MKISPEKKRYARNRRKNQPRLSARVFVFLIVMALICEAIAIVVNERLEQHESSPREP